ncbi:MAG: hypothetical protein AAFU73_19530 [Planctomycetota bacterium]
MNLPIARALLAAALAASMGCGPNDAPTEPDAPAGPSARAQDPTADSAGRLQVVDPENPRRPFFVDFGEVTWGEVIDWETRLTNVGPEPVALFSAQPACGCTRLMRFTVLSSDGEKVASAQSVSSQRPLDVPPGGTLVMRQQLVTDKAFPNENKLALIRLLTTSADEPIHTLEVRFIPMRRFYHDQNGLQARAVPVSHGGEAKLKLLTRSAGERMRILRIADTPAGFTARVEQLSQSGQPYWLVYLTVPPLAPFGVQRGSLEFVTTDDDGEGEDGRYRVPYVVQVVPDVSATPSVASFGLVQEGAPAQATSELRALVPGARLGVRSATVEGPDGVRFEASYEPERPDDAGRSARWSVTLSAPDGLPVGKATGVLRLELDEPFGGGKGEGGNVLELRIRGQVQPR